MRKTVVLIGVVAMLMQVCGCRPVTPQPAVQVRMGAGQQRIVSLAIDSRDYDEVARLLYESVVSSGKAKRGSVVALGPIAVNLDTGTSFDPMTLQDKLRTLVTRSGTHQFSMAVEAVTAHSDAAGNKAFQACMQARRLLHRQKNIDNEEDDIVWGGLAKVDYLIYGRLSSTSQRKGRFREVTYRFNYKLGDCRTGLLAWTDEVQYTKSR